MEVVCAEETASKARSVLLRCLVEVKRFYTEVGKMLLEAGVDRKSWLA
jgi:hypothetical protein